MGTSESVKRYDIYAIDDFGVESWVAEECVNGRFVEYDTHAADRAALVAQLEAAKERYGWLLKRAQCDGFVTVSELAEELEALAAPPAGPTHAALVAQVAELTRERDEARATDRERVDFIGKLDTEIARLTEALGSAQRAHYAAEGRARELEARQACMLESRQRLLEAEQDILNAVRSLSDDTLSLWAGSPRDSSAISALGWAELARREALRG